MSGENSSRNMIIPVFVDRKLTIFFLHFQVSETTDRFWRQRRIRCLYEETVRTKHRFLKPAFELLVRNVDLLIAQFGNRPLLIDGRAGGED